MSESLLTETEDSKKINRVKQKKQKNVHSAQLDLDFDAVVGTFEKSESAKAMILSMLVARKQIKEKKWRGLIAVPPGTLIEDIICQFSRNTSIPLEIPFFTFLSLVSGYLLDKNVFVKTEACNIRPDVWTVILASSGSGKTFTYKTITKALEDITEFPGTGIVSAAAFVRALIMNPSGIWIRDEFAKFLNKIEDEQGPMSEMKDYLLRLYDNSEISRMTKDELLVAESPALTILGLTVLETFKNYVSVESMLDGFAQRFSYVISLADESRNWKNFPLWTINNDGWQKKWQAIKSIVHEFYTVDPDVFNSSFKISFQAMFNESVPETFYRRQIWKATKYALIYHIIRNDERQELQAEDFGWAARVISMHINDAAWIIGEHNLSSLEILLRSAEIVNNRIREKHNRNATNRELVAGVRAIKTVGQAEQIAKLLAAEKQ